MTRYGIPACGPAWMPVEVMVAVVMITRVMAGRVIFAWMMFAWMPRGMMFTFVMFARMAGEVMLAGVTVVMFAWMSAGVMFTTVLPTVSTAMSTTTMPPTTAVCQQRTGQQRGGQQGQSAAKAKNSWFCTTAGEIVPRRYRRALQILALGRQLDEGFHRWAS